MDVIIKDKKRNEMLKRNEITAVIKEDTIPSKEKIKEKLCAQMDVPADRLVIFKVDTRFGDKNMKVLARAYDSPEQMKKVEQMHILKRNFKELREVKKAEAGPEAPPANFKK